MDKKMLIMGLVMFVVGLAVLIPSSIYMDKNTKDKNSSPIQFASLFMAIASAGALTMGGLGVMIMSRKR